MTIKQTTLWALVRYALRQLLGTDRGGKVYDALFLYVQTGNFP